MTLSMKARLREKDLVARRPYSRALMAEGILGVHVNGITSIRHRNLEMERLREPGKGPCP